jgi:hypothetical protein
MCAEDFHDGFMSLSGSRRMRVRVRMRTPEQASSHIPTSPPATDDPLAPLSPGVGPTSTTSASTRERRPRPGVTRRGRGRRLSRDLPLYGLRARGPSVWMDVLRGVVILGLAAFALWVDWIVAKAVVRYLSSWF